MSTETDAGLFTPPARRSSTVSKKTENTSLLRKESLEEGRHDQRRETTGGGTILNVTKTDKRFEERRELRREKFEYSREGREPGLVLIFNQEIYPEPEKNRTGSTKDTNDIIICFQRLGFNIEEQNVLIDANKKTILEKLENTASLNFSEYNSLIIFFLCHGIDNDKLLISDGAIDAYKLWKPFIDCPMLNNKPKMFVIQACKGSDHSTTNATSSYNSEIVPGTHLHGIKDHIGLDVLIAYSTVEGNESFRHTVTGSWFIQELCKNFMAYGKRDDVVSLLIRTSKCVAGNYYHQDSHDNYLKQMPTFISTLSKKFYLNTNKDRDILLRILETHEKILKELQEINEKIQ